DEKQQREQDAQENNRNHDIDASFQGALVHRSLLRGNNGWAFSNRQSHLGGHGTNDTNSLSKNTQSAITVALARGTLIPSDILRRITEEMAWVTLRWKSSMTCMLSEGRTTHTSHKLFILPPSKPVRPTVRAPCCLATSSATSTFDELPLPLIANTRSPDSTRFCSCCANTCS